MEVKNEQPHARLQADAQSLQFCRVYPECHYESVSLFFYTAEQFIRHYVYPDRFPGFRKFCRPVCRRSFFRAAGQQIRLSPVLHRFAVCHRFWAGSFCLRSVAYARQYLFAACYCHHNFFGSHRAAGSDSIPDNKNHTCRKQRSKLYDYAYFLCGRHFCGGAVYHSAAPDSGHKFMAACYFFVGTSAPGQCLYFYKVPPARHYSRKQTPETGRAAEKPHFYSQFLCHFFRGCDRTAYCPVGFNLPGKGTRHCKDSWRCGRDVPVCGDAGSGQIHVRQKRRQFQP